VRRPRLLIDENLSVRLVELAHSRGYEAAHVAHLGLKASKDWELMHKVADEDWVIVTNNAVEFRGRYRGVELHPGVVFVIPNVRREGQLELFAAALDELDRNGDLVNLALDVLYEDGKVVVSRYPLP
jgi:predicted nuclease of predicted toxin-antitoxin system